jgi:hypothetical protein
MPQTMPAQPSLTCFNVVFTNQDTAEVVVLRSARDANHATIALDDERTRLVRDQVRGELRLVRHSDMMHTLLRESLGSAAFSS